MDMKTFVEALTDKCTGIHYDNATGQRILVFGGKIIGGYNPTWNEDNDLFIEQMLWRKALFTPNTDFNLTHPAASQVKS